VEGTTDCWQGLKEVPWANWPMVDIKKQGAMFFTTIKKLKALGLPKAPVTHSQLFEGLNVSPSKK
jgi:hypothetical protein